MSAKPIKKELLFRISEYNPTDKLSKEDVAKDNPIIEAIEALRSFSPFYNNSNNFAFEVYSLGSPTAIIMPTTIPHTVTIAKKRFFDDLPQDAFALTNADEKNGAVMLQNTRTAKHTYALNTLADYKGRIIESRLDGTTLEVNGREVEVQFVGKFNAYNLLAVYGAACLLGENPEKVLIALSRLVPVSGRFQTLHAPQKYTAIIDYAHTPDALTNVLTSIREVVGRRGHVITVVGAGGNRDKGKRPLMAQEAAKWSDKVILTSDNPRYEKPQDILDDMLAGLDAAQRRRTLVIADRREAIRAATQLAQPGDVVLVAGKGHEDYQEIEGVKHHFNDREEVERLFNE